MEDVLTPAHLFARNIKAAQGTDDCHREDQRPGSNERQKEQAANNQQAEKRNDEVRDFENSVPFRGEVAPVPIRRALRS